MDINWIKCIFQKFIIHSPNSGAFRVIHLQKKIELFLLNILRSREYSKSFNRNLPVTQIVPTNMDEKSADREYCTSLYMDDIHQIQYGTTNTSGVQTPGFL